jgi:lipoate-protein ligase A
MWRIIDSGPGSAAWNMALDEALLLAASKEGFVPTLRFFSWDKPSLSIGSFQKTEELDLTKVKEAGVPLVRRPTGGRAVLHDAELTYSIACPIPSPHFPSDLLGSYNRIGTCFVRGLKALGIEAGLYPLRRDGKSTPNGHNPLCFSSPSWYEVLIDNKKLIGSAQRRLKSSFLQQGSLLIKLDIPSILSFQQFKDDEARMKAQSGLVQKMTALHEHKSGIGIEELKSMLVKGFQDEMGAGCSFGEVTEEESSLAGKLLEDKYSRESWNLYRQKA